MTTTPAVGEALARLAQSLDSPLRRTDAEAILAHIAGLEARLAEAREDRDQVLRDLATTTESLMRRAEAAEAKAAASEADARRFGVAIRSPDFTWNGRRWPMLDHDELRAAIDAARVPVPGGEGNDA